jgi:hypothetical protein
MNTARSLGEAEAFFIDNHRDNLKVIGEDGVEMEVDCYPSAKAFFDGERDPEAIRKAGD